MLKHRLPGTLLLVVERLRRRGGGQINRGRSRRNWIFFIFRKGIWAIKVGQIREVFSFLGHPGLGLLAKLALAPQNQWLDPPGVLEGAKRHLGRAKLIKEFIIYMELVTDIRHSITISKRFFFGGGSWFLGS